jgi:methylated-DNA-[protein]-cysteine S-methyltransferase
MRPGGPSVIGPVSKIRVRRLVHDVLTSRIGIGQRLTAMSENTNTIWSTYESPLGRLTLVAGPRGLRAISFPGHGGERPDRGEVTRDPGAVAVAVAGAGAGAGAFAFGEVTAQLDEYFSGVRRDFDIALDLDQGTPFARSVWAEIARIPYGSTTSYGAIARAIGRLDRVRAVGSAVGRTPVPIIVPCHRVVGTSGDLVGYGGGLARKVALLELESEASGGRRLPALWDARQLSLL